MAEKREDEPTQKTPKGAEIPVPEKSDWERNLKKVTSPQRSSGAVGECPNCGTHVLPAGSSRTGTGRGTTGEVAWQPTAEYAVCERCETALSRPHPGAGWKAVAN